MGWVEVWPQTRRPDAANVFMFHATHARETESARAGSAILVEARVGGEATPTTTTGEP